jgi:hypothetical protein
MKAILKVGAEGGSITLTAVRRKQGWQYRLFVDDQTPEFLDEPSIQYNLNNICSWKKALRLLDRYHWHQLYPLEVHPEFRHKIRAAFRRRVAKTKPPLSADRWREILKN